MPDPHSSVINLASEAVTDGSYENHAVATVNDHVVRISVMTEPYHWHLHPDSDETFLALEGGLLVDLDDRTIELAPGCMFSVPRGVRHRTRPLTARSVNLTFERNNARSEPASPPPTEAVYPEASSDLLRRHLGRRHGAEAEAGQARRARVRTHLQRAQHLIGRGRLVMEPEYQHARLHLFG